MGAWVCLTQIFQYLSISSLHILTFLGNISFIATQVQRLPVRRARPESNRGKKNVAAIIRVHYVQFCKHVKPLLRWQWKNSWQAWHNSESYQYGEMISTMSNMQTCAVQVVSSGSSHWVFTPQFSDRLTATGLEVGEELPSGAIQVGENTAQWYWIEPCWTRYGCGSFSTKKTDRHDSIFRWRIPNQIELNIVRRGLGKALYSSRVNISVGIRVSEMSDSLRHPEGLWSIDKGLAKSCLKALEANLSMNFLFLNCCSSMSTFFFIDKAAGKMNRNTYEHTCFCLFENAAPAMPLCPCLVSPHVSFWRHVLFYSAV